LLHVVSGRSLVSADRSPVVVVTGAGRGIGAATAMLAAERGWAVAINYVHDTLAARALADDILAEGGDADLFRADVADPEQVAAMFAAVDARFGHDRLRGLVNNAGIVDHAARVDEMTPERLQRMFAVHVFGAFHCAREALRRMSHRFGGGGGAIVNVSSVASRLGSPGQYVDYAAAKAAIDTFTVGLAREVAGEGVRVNAVRPGIVDTEIHASGGQPERAQQMAAQIPMQRPGRADEIAQAIVWLLSPQASYTTGAILDVGGGR
jgi:NAD(P)-dependent dehydrogenase (short-subunit alcohol dehydrogenase family)